MGIRFETPILHTHRLLLRPVTLNDVPTIQRDFGQWNIIKNMTKNCPWPYPEGGALHWFQHFVQPKYADQSGAIWAIARRENPNHLLGIIDIREDVGQGNRGFWLAEGEWGQGLMTEAVNKVTDWIFAHTSLTELTVYNVASNLASRRVKEKTGAEFVGTVVEEYHCGDTESEVWRIRKDAWLMSRSP